MQARLFSTALRCAVLSLAIFVSMPPLQAASNLNSSKSNIYRAVATDAERAACLQAGGIVVVLNGRELCQAAQANPEPQEGITITGCETSASGDPLKGLNVSKGGKSSGGQLCP